MINHFTMKIGKINVFSLLLVYMMGGCQPVDLWICKEVNVIGVLSLSNPRLFKAFIFLFIKQYGGLKFSDFSHFKRF